MQGIEFHWEPDYVVWGEVKSSSVLAPAIE